jgi:outer membrane receptor protein involved in Fe transport
MSKSLRVRVMVGGAQTAVSLLVLSTLAAAQNPAQSQQPEQPPQPLAFREQVEVVATRLPHAPHDVPTAIEVIDGDTVRNLGARTLGEALALSAGVVVAPGGDRGPAGSVPEFWGLREFDAFLLVVDDIPWGGAFNPALPTLSLQDVERVEIARGPAPVTYGATSFVGVIHVVHRPGTAKQTYATAHVGSFASGGGAIDVALPHAAGWESRLSVDGERQGFSDDRTSFSRGHALWRGTRSNDSRRLWATFDLNILRQDPASPSPRVGTTLTSLVPIDANQNPSGAFLDDTRVSAAFGMEQLGWRGALWTTTASFSHSGQDDFRGFLTTTADTPNNATGLREQIGLFDIYGDSHLTWGAKSRLRFVAGGDFLHGNGDANGATFTYSASLVGASVPVVTLPSTLSLHVEDRREFFGAYTLAEWDATPRLRVSAGVRLNLTFEEGGEGVEIGTGQDEGVTNVRPSGTVGAIFTGWQHGADHVKLYLNYRDTFKPAAVDFGLGEAQGGVEEAGKLKPETGRSFDGGLKVRTLEGRVDFEADAFVMNFANLVTATTVNGLPALMNTGTQRFQGLEVATDVRLPSSLLARASYSFHDAHFTDFAQTFDGVPTSLSGNRLELSARHLFSGGVVYAPSVGPTASLVVNYTGSRYLNRRNTALAEGFATIDVGVGYRLKRWDVRIDGRNLSDRRDPVSESELGDAQYYRMPARRAVATVGARF